MSPISPITPTHVGSKVSKIKRELLETVTAVSVIYRDSFPEKYIGGMPPN
jgi:hypothetical protein